MLWMITDVTRTPSVAATVESIVRFGRVGLLRVTIRPEGLFSDEDLRTVVAEILAKCPRLEVFIRGEPASARRCGAAGLHLRSSSLGRVVAVRAAAPDLFIAVSAHSPTEFEQAFTDGADYVFYSPVFPPLSKPYDQRPTVAPVKREGLYLLGGIDRSRAERLIRQGFVNLAAVSLFYSQTAVNDVEYLLRLMQEVSP